MRSPGFFMQVGSAFHSYFRAAGFLFSHGLWIYLFYPVLLLLLLLAGGFALADTWSAEIRSWLLDLLNMAPGQSGWTGTLSVFFSVVLSVLLKIMIFFLLSWFAKFLVLVLMSPVMSLLSERTEQILTGRSEKFSVSAYLKNIIRGIGIALRNFLAQLLIMAGCLAIVWIPLVGWLSPLLLMLTSWYFYGFSMIDYYNERHKMNISDSIRHVRRNKTIAVVNGFVFSFLSDIPLLGIIFAPVLAPVAACIAMSGQEKNK